MDLYTLYYRVQAQIGSEYSLDEFGLNFFLSKEEIHNGYSLKSQEFQSVPVPIKNTEPRMFSFLESFINAGITDSDYRFKFEKNSVILIRLDLANTNVSKKAEIPPSITIRLLKVIHDIKEANNLDFQKNIQFRVLLPKPPLKHDFIFNDLISELGDILTILTPNSEDNLFGANQESLGLIATKMIRRIGHFEKNGMHYKYFYDGEYCTNEITLVLRKLLIQLIEDTQESELLVFYDYRYSKLWMKKCLDTLVVEFDKIQFVDITNAWQVKKKKRYEKIILLLDLINTGLTANNHFQAIKQTIKYNKIQIISTVICSASKAQIGPAGVYTYRNRKLMNNEPISYLFHGIPLREVPEKYYLDYYVKPTSHEEYDNGYKFNSYIFWSLVREASFIPENDVPVHREEISNPALVPKFERIMQLFGPFVVKKLHLGFQSKNLNEATSVILCPDESGASTISYTISSILNIGVVTIPREVLTKVHDGTTFEEDIQENPNWVRSLRDLAYQSEIIIFDDFTVSGNTLKSMTELISTLSRDWEMNFQVVCTSVFADFRDSSQVDSGEEIMSLYDYNLSFVS